MFNSELNSNLAKSLTIRLSSSTNDSSTWKGSFYLPTNEFSIIKVTSTSSCASVRYYNGDDSVFSTGSSGSISGGTAMTLNTEYDISSFDSLAVAVYPSKNATGYATIELY